MIVWLVEICYFYFLWFVFVFVFFLDFFLVMRMVLRMFWFLEYFCMFCIYVLIWNLVWNLFLKESWCMKVDLNMGEGFGNSWYLFLFVVVLCFVKWMDLSIVWSFCVLCFCKIFFLVFGRWCYVIWICGCI